MNDFDSWYLYEQRKDAAFVLTREQARAIYDNYYSCECNGCKERKARGFMPIRWKRDDCTCPLSAISIDKC